MTNSSDTLKRFQDDLGLTNVELWWRYFALGGNRPPVELEAIMYGALLGTTHDLDVVTAALNEESWRTGGGFPLPYHGEAAP